ncbi:CotH kinase family protein [Crocinitomicaceae bacterium]|nr:CotH kinase family protein [Crocinitomicaceae bacterium]
MINTIKLAKIFTHLVGLAVIVLSCQTKSNHKLPIIHIRYYSDNLSLADYKKINFKIENQKKTKASEYNPKVKYRGNSSFKYTKKSYSLKFKNPRPLFHLPASKFWKLNAEYIDKTLMRNKLSYTLFRSFTPENFAPRLNYVVLYENQYYQGIYSVTEAVDEYRLELNLSDADAVLFKEPPFHNPPSEHNERAKKFAEYSQRSKRYITFSPKARKKLIAESYYNQRYPRAIKKKKSFMMLLIFYSIRATPFFKNKYSKIISVLKMSWIGTYYF